MQLTWLLVAEALKRAAGRAATCGTSALGGQIQADMETQRDNQRQWVERLKKWRFGKRKNEEFGRRNGLWWLTRRILFLKDDIGQQSVSKGRTGAETPKYLSDVRIFTIKVTIIDAQAA